MSVLCEKSYPQKIYIYVKTVTVTCLLIIQCLQCSTSSAQQTKRTQCRTLTEMRNLNIGTILIKQSRAIINHDIFTFSHFTCKFKPLSEWVSTNSHISAHSCYCRWLVAAAKCKYMQNAKFMLCGWQAYINKKKKEKQKWRKSGKIKNLRYWKKLWQLCGSK